MLWSFLKVIVFSIVVILAHCYYGYTATGGPAGVGVAVGRAVRTSIVLQMLLDFFLQPGHLGRDHDGADRRMSERALARLRYQLLRAGFLVVAALFVALSVAFYRKAFTPTWCR